MDMQTHLNCIEEHKKAIWREKIAIAQMVSPGDKLLAGPRLFDQACDAMKARIRELNPHMSNEEVLELLGEALDMAERLEVLGCRVELPESDWIEDMLKR